MIDAYTTMSNFPYSEQQSLSDLTQDTLSRQNKTASQPNDKINYIRNSVKATVDAYDGTIHSLRVGRPGSSVEGRGAKRSPGSCRTSRRCRRTCSLTCGTPRTLFEVQRGILEQYHVDDPVTFYNVRDSGRCHRSVCRQRQPATVLCPGQSADGRWIVRAVPVDEPMKVNNRQNLAAYISVDSDPGPNYGKMTVLKIADQFGRPRTRTDIEYLQQTQL